MQNTLKPSFTDDLIERSKPALIDENLNQQKVLGTKIE
jgi:hypothetical protein